MRPVKSFDRQFSEVVRMIHNARYSAIKSVNVELVKLYWSIGEYISRKVSSAEWGDAVVDNLADYIRDRYPEYKGFTRRGLYRMRQFYETYCRDKFVSPVVTQISWTNHLLVLSKTKSREEREFYIRLSIKESYSKRDLERQIDSGYYERVVLSKKKVPPSVTQIHPVAQEIFKDTYVLDFLNLPDVHTEQDLQRSIVSNLKNFILEFGKDFTFVGQEYRLQLVKMIILLTFCFFTVSCIAL